MPTKSKMILNALMLLFHHFCNYNCRSATFLLLCVFSLTTCVSKDRIHLPSAKSSPHSELAKMRDLTLERKNDGIFFGQSKKYQKRDITIALLRGTPYEMGYARGVLLKNEVSDWVKECLYMIRTHRLALFGGERWMYSRAKKVETFIPPEYREELRGLSAGSGIAYDTLLMLNVLETVARGLECTSVVVIGPDGKLLRSRNMDHQDIALLRPWILVIYQPNQGYAFASISTPGFVGLWTGINEMGLTFGTHAINGAESSWRGIPACMLNRRIVQYASTIEEAGEILEKAPRAQPKMFMVSSPNDAGVYEYDTGRVALRGMEGDHLILTNHTQRLRLSSGYPHSIVRFEQAVDFLARNRMDIQGLVELNRLDSISWLSHPYCRNLHGAIFKPEDLYFWVALESPPAVRKRWVGFNLKRELYGKGEEPSPTIIPAMSDVTEHRYY